MPSMIIPIRQSKVGGAPESSPISSCCLVAYPLTVSNFPRKECTSFTMLRFVDGAGEGRAPRALLAGCFLPTLTS